MNSTLFFILAATLFVSQTVFADTWPNEWTACKISEDCTVVSSSCGPSQGINRAYKNEAYADICKTQNCSGTCDSSARQAYAALCVNGRCAPDYTAPALPAPTHFELKNLELKCPDDHPDCGVEHR